MLEEFIEPITIYCENNISKNLVMHAKIMHMSIKYHYLRERIQEK